MNKQVGIFIPARLQSQRLENKLILPIGDTCLFEIACKKLNEMPLSINRYTLISDIALIDIAKKYSNIQIIIRDEATSKAEGPLSFIFKEMQQVEDTHLMFLNPCLAFLSPATIFKCIRFFEKSSAEYATSAKLLQNWIFDKNGKPINPIDYTRLTTKEIEPLFQAAHCFHIFNKDRFFEDGHMLKEGFIPLYVPEEETIDVDTREEYLYAKWRIETGNRYR